MSDDYADRRRRWLALQNVRRGLCGCGRQRMTGRPRCSVCLGKIPEWNRRRKKRMRADGLCTCGRPLMVGQSLCIECNSRNKNSQAVLRSFRRANRLCLSCGAPVVPGKSRCDRHLAQQLAIAKARWESRRR